MLRQCMDVLRLFGPGRTELGVTEIATEVGRPKSTVSRWLTAMTDAGFVERDADTLRYRLSMRLAALGEVARQSTSLQQTARGALEELTRVTGETTNLVVRDGRAAVNVEGVASPRPVQHVGVLGRRLPLHATAAGKVLLAALPDADRQRVLEGPLERFTPRTVTCPDTLLAELREVRRRGYATAWREMEDDLAAVAAPIRDHRGTVTTAVVLSAPISRVTPESLLHLAGMTAEAARGISLALGWRPSRSGGGAADSVPT